MITVAKTSCYSSSVGVLCVAAKEATRNVSLRQEVRDCLRQPERRMLMQLVDAQNLLRERISLASFIVGFKLAQEITKDLEVVPHGKETS